MTGRVELAIVAGLVTCCAVKALLVAGVLAAGAGLLAGTVVFVAAGAVVGFGAWRVAMRLRRRGGAV